MTTADPFLPEQGDTEPGADDAVLPEPPAGTHPSSTETGEAEEIELDAPVADVIVDGIRAEHPDPEGDGRADEGLPPMTPSLFRAPAGESVDPTDD